MVPTLHRRSRRAKHSGTQTMPQCMSWARCDACAVVLLFGKLWYFASASYDNCEIPINMWLWISKLFKVTYRQNFLSMRILSSVFLCQQINLPSSKTLQSTRSDPLKSHLYTVMALDTHGIWMVSFSRQELMSPKLCTLYKHRASQKREKCA